MQRPHHSGAGILLHKAWRTDTVPARATHACLPRIPRVASCALLRQESVKDSPPLEEKLRAGLETEMLFEESIDGRRLESELKALLKKGQTSPYLFPPPSRPRGRNDVTRSDIGDLALYVSKRTLEEMLGVLWEKVWGHDSRWHGIFGERWVGPIRNEYPVNIGIGGYLFGILRHPLANAVDAVVQRWYPNVNLMEIRIRSFIRQGELWIELLDNGSGVPTEVLPKLGRERYTTKSARQVGTFGREGVGLLMASQMSDRHGWKFIVANRSDGIQGTVASLVIPLGKTTRVRAGLEERVGEVARVVEEAAVERGQVVILEAAGLEEFPAVQAVVERLKTLAGQVIVLGRSPAAEEIKGWNPRVLFASGLEELAGLLVTLRQRGITEATYLGRASATVEAVVREMGLIFTGSFPSVAKFLAGLGVPGPLAAELTAGLEQVEATAGEA